jgi:hypothetical protein
MSEIASTKVSGADQNPGETRLWGEMSPTLRHLVAARITGTQAYEMPPGVLEGATPHAELTVAEMRDALIAANAPCPHTDTELIRAPGGGALLTCRSCGSGWSPSKLDDLPGDMLAAARQHARGKAMVRDSQRRMTAAAKSAIADGERFNVGAIAETSGLTRPAVYDLMRRHGLDVAEAKRRQRDLEAGGGG